MDYVTWADYHPEVAAIFKINVGCITVAQTDLRL